MRRLGAICLILWALAPRAEAQTMSFCNNMLHMSIAAGPLSEARYRYTATFTTSATFGLAVRGLKINARGFVGEPLSFNVYPISADLRIELGHSPFSASGMRPIPSETLLGSVTIASCGTP